MHLPRLSFPFAVLLICIMASCSKKSTPSTPEVTLAEKRKADAAHNNGITPGVGNVLIEEKLTPNAANQLVFKIAYNEDTLAGYGKIDANGKMRYLTSTVLAKKGNTELLVTEMFPEVSKSRMYTLLNGKKGSIVVEMNHISHTRSVMSILNYNWGTGTGEVLVKSYFENGKQTAGFSALKEGEGGDRVYNCIEPQPSDDVSKSVDNTLDYFQCGGLAYDTHPTLAAIKAAIVKGIESVKNAGNMQDKKEELKSLEARYGELNNLFKSIQGKVAGYKFEKTILAGLLRNLAATIAELKAALMPDVSLKPFAEGSLLDYDEVTDDEIKLTFTLIDNETNLPYTKQPVGVDMAFVIPGTSEAVFMETKMTSTANGMVTFRLNPKTIPEYEKYTKLTARYAFSGDNWDPSATRDITLKYIKPKLVMADGSDVPYQATFNSGVKKTFKLVNEDGRAIPVNYNDVTLQNSNAKVAYTMLKGTQDFDLTLSHEEAADQLTNIDVYYKQQKLRTISAIVIPPCGTDPVITGVTMDCNPKGNGIRIKVAFKADGPGIIPYGGSGACDMTQTCYPVRLYFMNPGAPRFEIAANGYDVALISGTVNEGVVAITIKNCVPGKDARGSLETYYPNYRWQVQVMNRCNKRSALVDL
ncbi:hypothetical protein [Chitinophaga caseinilytica]|uniref:hypothetical protein n=1 Tax=Chitinophaga caseinilytica TaxID=2267521 RepID=UPI003C2CC15A